MIRTMEGASKMVLRDYNAMSFVTSILLVAAGSWPIATNLEAIGYSGQMALLARIAGALFVLVGMYFFASAQMMTAVLDKTAGKIRISTASVLRRKTEEIEIGKLTGLELSYEIITGTSRRGGTRETKIYSLAFACSDGNKVLLALGHSKKSIIELPFTIQDKKLLARQVADFIGIPLKSLGEE